MLLRRFRDCVIIATAVFAFSARAFGIIVESGAANDSPPAPADGGDPGFNNVGLTVQSNSSCVYLGGRWVLAAQHEGDNQNIMFHGVTYNIDPNSFNRNIGAQDLQMFRITQDPGLDRKSVV